MWQSCRAVRIQRVRIPDETKAKRAPETIKGFTFTIFFLPREGSRGGGGSFSEREVAECPRSAIPLFFPSATEHSPRDSILFLPFSFNESSLGICIEIQRIPRLVVDRNQDPTHSSGPLDATKFKWSASHGFGGWEKKLFNKILY